MSARPCLLPNAPQGWLEAAFCIAANRGVEHGFKQRQYIRPVRAVMRVLERGLSLQDDNWASGMGQGIQSRRLAFSAI